METGHALSSPLGRITISSDAIARIVGETARECYGVVGMAGRKWLPDRATRGIEIGGNGDGVTIDLHVVVEYGLNLAEVASTIRNRVTLRGRAAHGTFRAGGRGAHRRREEERMTGLNGDREAVERLVDAALASLEANRARIDDLNVYPVPDGDTGTNLTMTVRAVADAVDHTSAASRHSLARDVARGALMGARGNSGVIFSQIVRGAADVLGETDEPMIDARGDRARAARRERRRVPRGAPSRRRDDALGDPRARRGSRGARAGAPADRRAARSTSCAAARTRSRARRTSCRC